MTASRFPRMSAYLANQPQGLASHPECMAKGPLVRVNTRGINLTAEQAAQLPPEVAALYTRLPANRSWVPEVHAWAVLLASADLLGVSEGGFDAWAKQHNREFYANPVFRLVLSFTSPRLTLPMAATYWGVVHRGSTLRVTSGAEGSASLLLESSHQVFDAICARCLTQAFAVGMELSAAKDPFVRLENWTPTTSAWTARWS